MVGKIILNLIPYYHKPAFVQKRSLGLSLGFMSKRGVNQKTSHANDSFICVANMTKMYSFTMKIGKFGKYITGKHLR